LQLLYLLEWLQAGNEWRTTLPLLPSNISGGARVMSRARHIWRHAPFIIGVFIMTCIFVITWQFAQFVMLLQVHSHTHSHTSCMHGHTIPSSASFMH
jgi:hypothetical protein